jgi:hypothetical protein
MKACYAIKYVMPRGSRVGLCVEMDKIELEQKIKKLQDKGCLVETIEILNRTVCEKA